MADEQTVFDRIGTRLVQVAANLLLFGYQVDISQKIISNVVKSQKYIEILDDEAIEQIESSMKAIEEVVVERSKNQREAIRALKESKEGQKKNREDLQSVVRHLSENVIFETQDDISSLTTLLSYSNYKRIVMTDVSLWIMMLKAVDKKTFEKAYAALSDDEKKKFG